MLNLQFFLKHNPIEELEQFNIRFKIYDDRIIFKYGINSPKDNPIVKECRGLILSKDYQKILSRPFDRFFNLGEVNVPFNWRYCETTFKHDGSLIQVYHDDNKWCVATSGTAFAEGTTPMNTTYFELFQNTLNQDIQKTFNKFNKNFTILFELVSPENRIVTKYYESKLFLLAIRNKKTGHYIKYEDDEFETPEVFYFNTPNKLTNLVNEFTDFKEGVVCFDPTTENRIKIKNISYVTVHHLRNNAELTKKSIIQLILDDEIDEYLTYFPEDKQTILPYITQVKNIKERIINTYNEFKDIEDQKEFALKVKDLDISGFIFAMRKRKDIKFDVNTILKLI